MMSRGKEVKELREKMGMNRREFSDYYGIPHCVYFSEAEGGRRGKKFTENYKEKHTIDAMYGWYRYESRFALPVFNEVGEIERYNVFNVIMVIRHAKDGKMYLYDIMNIKKETSTLFQSEDITQ